MENKLRTILSRQEIYKMIDLWGEYIDQLHAKHRNKDIYKDMSLEFRRRYRLTLSSGEIRTRINNLKKKFKLERKNVLSGRGASKWPYYLKVHKILVEGKPSRLGESFEESYADEEEADNTRPCVGESFRIPELLEKLKEDEDDASSSIGTNHQGKFFEEEFLKIAKEEQKNMKKYFENSLENEQKIIKLLEKNNDLISQLMHKA
ncbi:uncharacterized protein LOC110118635 [Ceratitis capitata]|uniref:(Mediterranean fruit fly) hypothetical protein n=1 Tax=Ceratitis capitata TaxID=7213 RepID=A0A811UFS5_CERCA|nr:uncharacterized protein LOC110118635 [Ceratitis capitata]CAD6996866.1 unnamed protein product [Ceratitis capitata]